jgi:ABC-type multidrug transport system fused ATPase/permease subunit
MHTGLAVVDASPPVPGKTLTGADDSMVSLRYLADDVTAAIDSAGRPMPDGMKSRAEMSSGTRGGGGVGPERALFAFRGVEVERDGVRALDGFDAAVPEGGVTAVFGPSRSGKSTMLRLCNRLEAPTGGRVLFRGSDIADLDPLRLRREVGMCFQRPTPCPGTVADNLRVADSAADAAQMEECWPGSR